MKDSPSIKVRIPDGILSLVDAYGVAIGSNRSETLRLLIHMALATDHVVGVIKRNATKPETADLIRENDHAHFMGQVSPLASKCATRGGV